jgi:enoyl-CoA hydratase/carnithine racemase
MNNILETKQEGRVLRLWLNRPSQRNSLTTELCHELIHVLSRAEKDRSVGSVLLAGKGESFCAGMDLNELATGDVESISSAQEILFTIGDRLTKPLIGAVQGAALGSGTGVVANCHVVIASENATFGVTGIRMGLWPFVFLNAVAAAVGERRALALAITGEIFNAAEALRIGLVHQVVPIEDVDQRALDVAQTVANYSAHALSSGLGFVREVQGQTRKAAASVGRAVRNEFLKSAEFRANLAAFLNPK